MRKLLTLVAFLLALGAGSIAECVAQQKEFDLFADPATGHYIFDYMPWEFQEPQKFIAEQKKKHPQLTLTPDMEEIPLLMFNEQMLEWNSTTRCDVWQKPYSNPVYINRSTGMAIKDSKPLEKLFILTNTPPPPLNRINEYQKPPLKHTFDQMPSDSIFVVDMPYAEYLWGCVDNGTLRLFCNANEFATFRDYAIKTFGSTESALSLQKRRAEVDKINREKRNRFGSLQEAEAFLRNDYSIFATTFPSEKTETLQRFIDMLARHTTLSTAERRILRRNKKQITTIAGIYDENIRQGEIKKMFIRLFDKPRQNELNAIIARNDELIQIAEERIIQDRYEGWLLCYAMTRKAICIHFIYGLKVPVPLFSLILKEDLKRAQRDSRKKFKHILAQTAAHKKD